MNYHRPIILSIAGFDPSGGAGILADVKTFEQHKCLGMSVISALTIQTEDQFFAVEWLTYDKIIQQLEPLINQYKIRFFKIGIIENIECLNQIINWIHDNVDKPVIIWDPIISASTGNSLLKHWNHEDLLSALSKITLITPNAKEIQIISKLDNELAALEFLSNYTSVLLKGGHRNDKNGVDTLKFENALIDIESNDDSLNISAKHGSGCILSAAILSNLSLGNNMIDACRNAKNYIEKRLISNPNLLAYHVE